MRDEMKGQFGGQKEEEKITENKGELSRAQEVWREAEVDTLAGLWAAFFHTERPSQIREGWLLCSPHAGLDRPGTDFTGTVLALLFLLTFLHPNPPPRVYKSQTVPPLPPLLPTSIPPHLSIPPRPNS